MTLLLLIKKCIKSTYAYPIAPPLDHLVYDLSDLPHKQSVGGSTRGFSEFGLCIDVGLLH